MKCSTCKNQPSHQRDRKICDECIDLSNYEPLNEETETAYKVEHNGSFCIVFLLSDALDLIKNEVEDNYSKGSDVLEFNLSVVEMTDEEINNLGEFEGF